MSLSKVNASDWGIDVQTVQNKLQLSDDRTLLLDPFFHNDIGVPF